LNNSQKRWQNNGNRKFFGAAVKVICYNQYLMTTGLDELPQLFNKNLISLPFAKVSCPAMKKVITSSSISSSLNPTLS